MRAIIYFYITVRRVVFGACTALRAPKTYTILWIDDIHTACDEIQRKCVDDIQRRCR